MPGRVAVPGRVASYMKTGPAIIVDDRQPAWQFPALEKEGFVVNKRRLETADLVWAVPYGSVGVEDKPVSALLTDIRNGRLNSQLERLRAKFTLPILFVRDDGYEKPEGFETVLFGRQLRGIVVALCPFRVRRETDFAHAVRRYYEYTQSAGRPLSRPYERHYPWADEMSAPAEVIHTILQQVPRLQDRTRLAMALAVANPVATIIQWSAQQWADAGLSKLQASRAYSACEKLR